MGVEMDQHGADSDDLQGSSSGAVTGASDGAEAPAPTLTDEPAYTAYTIAELKSELRQRDEQVSGSKDELMVRLAESKTVEELRDDLRDADQPVAGSKVELVERLTGVEVDPNRGKVAVHAGGHTIMADPVAPTPPPIQMCSVCGRDPDDCPHGDGGSWAVEEEG